MSKSIVTHSNNTKVKSEYKNRYFYLSKNKKVVKNYSSYEVKVESSLIFKNFALYLFKAVVFSSVARTTDGVRKNFKKCKPLCQL